MKNLSRCLALAGVVASTVLAVPSANGAALGQTASATEGTYAYGGSGPIRFGDGVTRDFAAILAVPRGVVTGSPAIGAADLTKPWAAVSVQGGSGSGGLVGSREVCHAFVNPSSWSAGGPGPRNSWGQPTYGGVSFSFSCAGDPSYRSFTVSFDPAVTSKGMAHGQQDYQKPEADTQLWGWSAGNGANGTLHANRNSAQTARMTVCGVRHSGEQDCVFDSGVSVIVPAASFSTEAYAVN